MSFYTVNRSDDKKAMQVVINDDVRRINEHQDLDARGERAAVTFAFGMLMAFALIFTLKSYSTQVVAVLWALVLIVAFLRVIDTERCLDWTHQRKVNRLLAEGRISECHSEEFDDT